MSETRKCSKCGESKPSTSEYFPNSKSCTDGLEYSCKVCRSAHQREWRKANEERIKKYQKTYRETNKVRLAEQHRIWSALNKEQRAEYCRKWREANYEHALEYGRKYHLENARRRTEYRQKYYAANADRVKERLRQWYENNKGEAIRRVRKYQVSNPETKRAANLRRKARERNAQGNHSGADIRAQHKAQRGKCYYCKTKVGDAYHVDHVIPLSRGGSNSPENIVIACATCNLSKHSRMPHEWSQGGRLL